MKCYIANPPAPSNPDAPFDETIKLTDSTTDKARFVDLRYLEMSATSVLISVVSFLSLMI